MFSSALVADSINIEKGDILYAAKVKNLFLEENKAIGRLLSTAQIEVLNVDSKNIELKVKDMCKRVQKMPFIMHQTAES
ncbi:hypothetical protein [Helicobacter ibis]|uniref:Uncharacterized protein n=1 Tax=Helicobacter ibis TaxID=2962633 RepID=A0ABT4VDD6_9HELI|nr:hypothetical protein [Helicobacter ibis]MDA3968155.1 hypothetical protein [Helicobacter ibis]